MKTIKNIILLGIVALMGLAGNHAYAQCSDGNYNCYIVITGGGSYSDSWSGSSITVSQGSNTLATFTANGYFELSDTIRVCTDNGELSFSWASGNYPSECYFTITDSLGAEMYSIASAFGLGGTFYSGMPCPTCPGPVNYNTTNLASTSATVTWTEPAGATEWYYQYGTTPILTGSWTLATAASVDLTGLNSNTMYYFSAYSVCGVDDTSSIKSFSFRTDCGQTVLPITEGFEDNGTDIPLCWQTFESFSYNPYGYYTYYYPSVSNSDWYDYGYNSPSAMALMSTSSYGSGVISPKMPVAANEVEVLLYLSGEDAIQVGYITTNDTNNAVFHLVGTAGPSTYNDYNYDYDWEQFTIQFDTVTTTDSIWVVIRRAPSLANDVVYIDDVTIRQLNSCADPSGLAVDESVIASGQVALTWNDETGNAWEIAYGPVGFDPDQMASPQMAYSAPATVENLDDQTSYDFYLRTVCGTQRSYWVGPVTARPNVYSVTASIDTITTCGMTIVDNGGFFGNFAAGTEQLIVLQPSTDDQAIRIQGSVVIGNGSNYGDEYMNKLRIFAGSDTTGMLLASYLNQDVYNIDITSEVGPMTIWFRGAMYNYYLDEGFQLYVSCESQASCTTPYNLAVSNITGTSATVSWEYNTALGDANGFTLYVIDPEEDVTTEYTLDGDARSLILTDLNERTDYLVRLALDCEGIDTVETTFTTVCTVGGDFQIGDGTSTSSYLPAYGYDYSIGQQIFTAIELEGVDTILGFKVYRTSSAASTKEWEVYMDTTSQMFYSNLSDYVTPDSNRLYFSGSVNMNQGWMEINFDSAFVVPAGKNITLTVHDLSGTYGSSSFRTTNTSDQMSVYGYSYYGDLDPLADEPFAGLSSYNTDVLASRNTIKFITPCANTDCVPPTITAADPDTHSVLLQWIPGYGESSWQVEYRHADSNSWTMATASVSDTSYEVTGLDDATQYVFRVSSLCSDTTVGRTTVAITLCGKKALPLTEDFEWFTATNSDPETERCWYRNSESSYYYYPYAYNYSTYAHSGNWSMSFSYYYNPRLVLPEFDKQVDSLNVEFYAMYSYSYGSTPKIEVGVCTDPNDTSTYTVVQTVQLESGEMEYGLVSVDLDSYNGPDGRIFIRSAADNSTSFYLDDLTVSAIPSCRNLTAASVDNLTDSEASLTITDDFGRTSYTILWSIVDDTLSATDSMTVATASATLTGLAPFTTYYVWVRANCGGGDNSRYLAVKPFTTLCSPIAVTEDDTWFNDFEDSRLDCMWQLPDSMKLYWQNTMADYYGAHPYSGGHMAQFGAYNDGATMLILPTFDFSGMTSNAELDFYHYQFTHTDYNVYPTPTLEMYYRTSLNGNWTLIAAMDTSSSNVWKKRIVELPASQGAAIYQVALKGRTMGNTYGVYLDDITVKGLSTCLQPQNVAVSNITDRTATVRWTGNAPAYKVQYRSEYNWNWNGRTVEDVDSCIIAPLDMATNYEVRVIALCGTFEQSEPSEVIAFATEFCIDRTEADNYTASAADASTSALMDVSRYYNYTEVLIDSATVANIGTVNGITFYVDNTYGTTGINNVNIYMGHTSATTMTAFQYDTTFALVYSGPIAPVTGMNRILLDTPYDWDDNGNLVVGFMTVNTNYYNDSILFGAHVATANKCYTGYRTQSFTPGEANMLPSGNKYATSTVPDLKIVGCNPVCFEPVVSDIATTESSITVTWYNENATVQVDIKLASESNWGLPITVDDANSYTFDNLPGMTDFDIRVRRDCSLEETGYSDWVTVGARTDTACSIPLDLTVTDVTGTTATIGWTDGAMNGGQWEIHVWNSTFNAYYDVNTNPATLDGLVAGETYSVAVRARCGSDNHVYGEFSDDLTFDNICHPVSNLQASVNGTSVNLTWTPGERNTQWLVSYGYRGYEPNEMLGYVIVNTPSATINGLGTATSLPGAKGVEDNTYAFRVRAICSEGWNSDWTDEVVATLEGIDEAEADGRISLSPNPATAQVTLSLAGFDGQAAVTVLGIDGREMARFSTADALLPIDVSQWAAGTYFVRVQTAGWTAVRKLIVK